MKKIDDIDTAIALFERASKRQAEATEVGDHRTGNKCYYEITAAAAFIKEQHVLERLRPFLSHPSAGVRAWTACYFLPYDEKEGIKVLEEIAKGPGIHSLDAETTLSEWRKGNLTF